MDIVEQIISQMLLMIEEEKEIRRRFYQGATALALVSKEWDRQRNLVYFISSIPPFIKVLIGIISFPIMLVIAGVFILFLFILVVVYILYRTFYYFYSFFNWAGTKVLEILLL